jgi:hypothetical protein
MSKDYLWRASFVTLMFLVNEHKRDFAMEAAK